MKNSAGRIREYGLTEARGLRFSFTSLTSFTSFTSEVSMTNEERKAALEAIIYAADEPATIDQLAKTLGEEKLAVQASLDELVASYATESRGIEVRAVSGRCKLYTKPQQHDVVRRFVKRLRPPVRPSVP